MACSFQYGKPCKLNFTFPEGGYKKNFKLNFCPAEGTQKTIIRCKWSDSYKCDTEDGFGIEFPSDNEALITLPEDLRDTPASLKYQFSGQTVTSLEGCSLPVTGNHTVDNNVEPQGGPNTTQMTPEPLLPMSEDSGKGDTNLGIVIGCIIGAVLIVLTILLIIFLFRRYKYKQCPCCPEKPNMNESPVSGPEADEKIFMLGQVNRIMVETEQIFPKKITRKETDVSDIDEMKPFLWNEQESNEKNACNKGSEKKISDGESDKTKNDDGFEEKGSDEKKSSDKESDNTENDEGFEEKESDEKKSSDKESDNTKNDEGFEEKGSDGKKSSDKESDNTKNDEGFEEKGSDEENDDEKSSDCDTDENNSDEVFEDKSGSSKLGGEKHE